MRKVAQILPVLGCMLVLTGVVVWLKGDDTGGPIGAGTGVIPREEDAAPPSALALGEPGFYLDLDRLRREADLAVHGAVRSVRVVSIGGTPFNEVMISVQRVLQPKDATNQEVTLLVYGAEMDGIATETDGTPELAAGQEVVLFLKEWEYGHVVLGIQQGLFRVVDEGGTKVAVRDYNWLSLIGDSPSLQEGLERLPLSTVLGDSPTTEPPKPPVPPVEPTTIPVTAATPVPSAPVVLAPTRTRSRGQGPGVGEAATAWAIVLVALGGVMVLASRCLSRRTGSRAGYTTARLLLLVSVATACLLLHPIRSRAYVTQTISSSNATELKWMFNDSTPAQVVMSTKSVKYSINFNGTAHASDAAWKTVVEAQAKTWNTVNFHWVCAADDTRPLSAIKGNDNMNTVYWRTSTTTDPHGKNMAGIPAWTFTQMNSTTGELLDTDIFLNQNEITWYTQGTLALTASHMDVGSAVTHEFGHASGLSHSPHQAATMNAISPVFDKYSGRSLERDDIIGILRKYPPSTFSSYTGRIAGTLKDNASTPRNIHSGIVLARRATNGVVVAAVLSKKGSYQIDGLEAGSYVIQTQCAGRSMNDAPGVFAAYWSTSPTMSWRSNSSQDQTVTVTAGTTKTANLTVTYGSLAMKIDSLWTYFPLLLQWGGGNAPLRVPRGALAFPIGLKGASLPTPNAATVSFGTSDIVLAWGPHADVTAPGLLVFNINVPIWATVGPRNIELQKSDGTRVIAIGALEIF